MQQNISNPDGPLYLAAPSVAQMSNLDFNIDAKLLYDHRHLGPGYNASIHASQFVHYLTIQNLNPASSGYGDFLWYGTDDRQEVTSLSVLQDGGTGKLIYDTGIAPYTSAVVADGNWVNVQGDLLPNIKSGLQEAWTRGFLLDSQNYSDGNDFLMWQQGGSPHGTTPGDLAEWQSHFGDQAAVTLRAVPEPGAYSLAALGAFLVSCMGPGRSRGRNLS